MGWIRNSTKVIQSGDPYAVELFKQYNQAPMPNFSLTDAEIKAILRYVQVFKAPTALPIAQGHDSGKP